MGTVTITGCPNAYCRSIASVIPLMDLFDKGMPPISGGVLDQSASFVEACSFFNREESIARANS